MLGAVAVVDDAAPEGGRFADEKEGDEPGTGTRFGPSPLGRLVWLVSEPLLLGAAEDGCGFAFNPGEPQL